MSKKAHILAIRSYTFPMGLGFGIVPATDDAISAIRDAEAWIGPRTLLELDRSFIQPIPYVVVRQGDRVLAYVRGAGGNEAGLHGKFSIGVGGHIDLPDIVVDETKIVEKGEEVPLNTVDVLRTLAASCVREISEEIGIDVPVEALSWSHVIHTNETPTDAVHLGIVATIDVDVMGVLPETFEAVIENATFETIEELTAGRVGGTAYEPETWTRLVLEAGLK